MKPFWTQPSHPEVLEVIEQPGSFSTYAQAQSDFQPGAVLGRLAAPTLTLAQRAYSSVQVSSKESIELNCDFLYINHSCEPNVEFHVLNSSQLSSDATEKDHPIVIEIRAASRRNVQGEATGVRKGEELTFFYPSTEWDMAQPFECKCKTSSCKGLVRGAKYLSQAELKAYFVNDHILKLKESHESGANGSNEGPSGSGSGSGSGDSGILTPGGA